jgi:hypothetical protein
MVANLLEEMNKPHEDKIKEYFKDELWKQLRFVT